MKAIDTNILVRFLLRDERHERAQYLASERELASDQVFIPDTVILETVWVLGRVYKIDREQYLSDIEDVAGLPNVTLENPQRMANTIAWHRKGLDFADALHLAASASGCSTLKTFDEEFVKKAKGLSGCKVVKAR